MKRLLRLGLMCLGIAAGSARGAASDAARFAYQERPGVALPAQAVFRDSDGGTVRLGDLSQGVPLILVPAYLHCPNLCGIVRASLLGALKATGFHAGRDYRVAILSIAPDETPAEARLAKAEDVKSFGFAGAEPYLHYLTGDAVSIREVTEAVGFRNRLDPATGQYIHPAGVVFVTSAGRVSNYLLGVGYTPAAVRSALERAQSGGFAAAAAPVLLICFHFDPSTGRYSLAILKVLRLAGVLAILTLAGMFFLLRRRERPRP